MAELLDSGARREFGNGAVRDVAEGKGRCDLLPLGVLSEIFNDHLLRDIEQYVRDGNTRHLISAIQSFSIEWFDGEFTAMLEVAKQYEDGARKYADRNWEKGIPVHVFIDSGVRHYLKYLRGDKDEPHDRAFIWNMLGAIWTHENKPELIDLPFADKPTENSLYPATPITQEVYEELFASEPVKGKYEGLSNDVLVEVICEQVGNKCKKCPISSFALLVSDACSCNIYAKDHPEDFRKIAIDYLEGLEGKA